MTRETRTDSILLRDKNLHQILDTMNCSRNKSSAVALLVMLLAPNLFVSAYEGEQWMHSNESNECKPDGCYVVPGISNKVLIAFALTGVILLIVVIAAFVMGLAICLCCRSDGDEANEERGLSDDRRRKSKSSVAQPAADDSENYFNKMMTNSPAVKSISQYNTKVKKAEDPKPKPDKPNKKK